MRILQLCNKSPLPPKEGGSIAMYHFAQALISDGHQIDVLTVTTPKYHPPDSIIEKYLNPAYSYENVYINTDVTLTGALKAMARNRPYHVVRFINENFTEALVKKLRNNKYDLIIFETLYMSPYLQIVRKHSNGICMLRSHNIEHQIWKRVAMNETNILKRWYLNYLAEGLKKYEKNTVGQFNQIACISDAEAEYYIKIAPGCIADIVPFAVDVSTNISNTTGGSGFYHMGSMDWWPNIEGIKWLIEKVVPILEKRCPDIRISLAGRNMPEWIRNTSSQILDIVGEVRDATQYIQSKSVLIVPLLSGSGIRIKIIEAMAMGKAVISTTTGAEGIHVTHDHNICLADTPEAFADAMIDLFLNPKKAFSMGLNGQTLITGNHNYQSAISAFHKLIGKFN